ncbi:MAG TPA: RNA polymerase sigma-70 factor, partial [Candidatus Butyricimonas faecavium]|nr:RNA polymerase sigma-70 factor [Candidatus Butyricimonas faecavium]
NEKQITAYEELFRIFYRYMVVYAYRFVLRKEVAEDLVQEIFIGIWETNKTFNSFYGFRAFLYNALRNSCINYLKHEDTEFRYRQKVMQEHREEEEDDNENYFLMREEMYRLLHEAIELLPEKCKVVFKLRLEGKKNEEIAEILKLSVETVKTQNKKALRFLREELKNLFQIIIVLQII